MLIIDIEYILIPYNKHRKPSEQCFKMTSLQEMFKSAKINTPRFGY